MQLEKGADIRPPCLILKASPKMHPMHHLKPSEELTEAGGQRFLGIGIEGAVE